MNNKNTTEITKRIMIMSGNYKRDNNENKEPIKKRYTENPRIRWGK